MRNIRTIFPGLLIILLVFGCGILDDLGIVVVVDDVNTTMRPQTAVGDAAMGRFAVANYDLKINKADITQDNNLKKPLEEKQILIVLAVNRAAGGADAESGKYTAKNISWIHVYYFKDGMVKKKVLDGFEGSVLMPKFEMKEGEIPVAVDIKEGNNSLKGAFSAKRL